MNYENLITYLNHKQFYPGIINKDGVIVGLHLDCVSLHQKEHSFNMLEKALVGTGYKAVFHPNILQIRITHNK